MQSRLSWMSVSFSPMLRITVRILWYDLCNSSPKCHCIAK